MPASNRSCAQDTASPAVSAVLTQELRWRRVFPGEERQLWLLRRWIAALLPECPARNDVVCVATELGTNAVRHTASGRGGWFIAEVTWYSQVVRVAVADSGAPTEPQLAGDPLADHGRGLLIVRALSVRTGVVGDARARLVWADIPWNNAGEITRSSVTGLPVVRPGRTVTTEDIHALEPGS